MSEDNPMTGVNDERLLEAVVTDLAARDSRVIVEMEESNLTFPEGICVCKRVRRTR